MIFWVFDQFNPSRTSQYQNNLKSKDKQVSHATHAPLIPPSSSIYNKNIGFKEKGKTKGG
jgi:hypothetical protein